MSNIFFYISIAGYVLAAGCLITAVILFFRFNIPYVIKDLNGTLAQQEIAALRKRTSSEKNARVRLYDPDKNRGKASGRMTGKTAAKLVKSASETDIQARGQRLYEEVEDSEMKTSILQFNKVINKDFVIVTDIMYINTDETMK